MTTTHRLRHWLLPHPSNNHHPLIVRPSGWVAVISLICGIILLQNLVVVGQPSILGFATNINTQDVLSGVNAERSKAGLSPLTYNQALNKAAQDKATDMIAKDYWAHVGPDGSQPWVFLTNAGYSYKSAGENLAKSFNTSSGVVAGWMNSSGHRANVLGTAYDDIGLAVVNGHLQGEDTTVVVAFFGRKLVAPAPVQTPPATIAEKPSAAPAPAVPAPSQPVEAPTEVAATTVNTEQASPQPVKYSLFKPLSATRTLGLAEQITLGLLMVLLFAILNDHKFRRARQWPRRHLAYPLPQTALLVIAVGYLLSRSFGVVG